MTDQCVQHADPVHQLTSLYTEVYHGIQASVYRCIRGRSRCHGGNHCRIHVAHTVVGVTGCTGSPVLPIVTTLFSYHQRERLQ